MCTQSGSELERPYWPGQCASQRESERGIVPFIDHRQHNFDRGKALQFMHA